MNICSLSLTPDIEDLNVVVRALTGELEELFTGGIDKAGGRLTHTHLYDPSPCPPGMLPDNQRLDWLWIINSLNATHFFGTGSVVGASNCDPDNTALRSASYRRQIMKQGG